MAIRTEISKDSQKRFWIKVNKTKTCWIWTAALNDSGYGIFGIGKATDKAHRIAWRLIKGEIPKGLFCCHICDNPKCVNPDHLFLGTNKDNVDDMFVKGRNSKPPSMGGWNAREWKEEELKLLGTMPDYLLAIQIGTNKHTVARIRNKMGIKSYAKQTGRNGQFNGEGFHPCWGTPLKKKGG